ncbi:hypothetical protein EBU94_01385 [bacterium]|nr:hypothetical protein [bacterium]NBO36149.1 hypothetical protein [bacterium]
MIIPLIWLKDYIEIEKTPQEIAKSFTELGLMLEKPILGEVLELEHRMDRADWLSILGCARDLSGFENVKFIRPKLKNIEVPKVSEKDKVSIEVESGKVNRFRTRVFKNVKVGESPDFIKKRLELYGIPVINNIVDITNFVMVEMGQPLHAQDLNKFEKREIILRDSEIGEKIQTLDGSKIELPERTLVLSQNNSPICIGGIVGGFETRVSSETTEIVLDSGNYNQASMRKTSKKLGIRNETLLRSEKFLSPNLVDEAITRCTDLILEYAGGEVYENSNYESEKYVAKKMTLTKKRLELVSGGTEYFKNAAHSLRKLEYEVLSENDEKIVVEVPHFRTDVEVEDDIVADILRLYGYSKIQAEKISAPVPEDITPISYSESEYLTNLLVSLGFHEHLTDSIVKYDGIENRISMLNSINSDKDSLRLSIKETLSTVLFNYQKFGKDEVKIFEIGKKYFRENDELYEELVLGVIYDISNKDLQSLYIRKYLDSIMESLGVNYSLQKTKKHISIIDSNFLVEVGYFDGNYVEVFLEKIINNPNFKSKKGINGKIVTEIENISKEDLTFVCHEDFSSGEVLEYVRNLNPLINEVRYLNEFLEDGKRKVTFRFSSLHSQEMKKIRNEIINNSSLKFQINFIS